MVGKVKIILLVIFGSLLFGNANGQWIAENLPTKSNLNSIHLFNDNSGWVVGDNGVMFHKDKDSWINSPKLTDENLYSVFLVDIYNGWAVGSKGTILYFDGNNWIRSSSPTKEKLYCVSFSDKDHGIAVGENGTVIIYENGTWKQLNKQTYGNFFAASATKDLKMIAGGLEATSIPIMNVLDNPGKNLVKTFDPDFVEIRSLATPGKRNAWAVGKPGTIFHFNGSTWEKLSEFEKLSTLNSVSFADENHGIAVGYGGTILTYSTDGWTKEISPVSIRLNGSCVSGNSYYAVGNNGMVVTLKNTSITDPESVKNSNSPLKIESYPNPTSDILNIYIPQEDGFFPNLISITNSFGQVVYRKKLDPANIGQVYQVNTTTFNNGLYLINIISSSTKPAVGKFIVKH
jgi:photosystem II stability/assembly factor-like uncharacterized protein